MKIIEVERLYLEKGYNQVDPDYRALVDIFRKLNAKEPIPNSDYLHGLYLNDLMFRGTSHHIRMLNGTGESNWLDVLKDSISKALARIKERNGFLKAIFVGGGETPDAIRKLQQKFGDQTVKFMMARTSEPVRHFIACDSSMLRLEDVHRPITQEMMSNSIKASVYLNNPGKTKTMEDEFDYIWDYLNTQD